ncbi:DUF2093 domain-containing protein [Sandaracinobacter sp. RS1-74]|uniref:DUF2093 domain-containing protein n=1 Tax=Sandaracinobacteroides sayramensis TaxID=2913411 RepID=UPI001EDB81F7|nr:DUF2093 domain-containing protein [Sandaracinobacteroides sayramensis]MCG2842644.1 DUF2093 domain-containing protein [Sandaracinobacteroides sayramensis]
MLNFAAGRQAKLRYLSGSFKRVSDGDHVLCAVTGRNIPLDQLRYWSHELQEAYASAEVAGARYAEARKEGLI